MGQAGPLRVARWLRTGVFGAALALGTTAAADTLPGVLATAYENSRLLESNRAVLRATDEDVAQAVALLRPVINAVSRTTVSDSAATFSTFGLSLDLLLYDFGATPLRIEAAKETVLATRASLVEVEQSVLLDAVTAYMDMRLETETVLLAENSLRLNQRELRAARDRFEVGEITRTDVSQAEARLAQARSVLALSQGDLEIARARFNLAVGEFPGVLAAPPAAPSIPATLQQAKSVARQNHPAIRRVQHQVKAAELNVARAVAAMQPNLRFTGELSTTGRAGTVRNRSEEASGTLNMVIPLYQGGGLRAAHRQAIANSESVRAELLQSALVIEEAVARAWALLDVARASIVARRQQIQAARLAFEGVREEAKLGSRTTLDVLDAEQELLSAQNDLLEARRDEYVATYSLLSAMGLLTVEHLGLRVEGYDPAAYYNAVRNAPARSVRGQRLDRVLERTRGN